MAEEKTKVANAEDLSNETMSFIGTIYILESPIKAGAFYFSYKIIKSQR